MFASTAEADADSATFETTGSTGSMTVLMGGGNDVLKLTNVFTGHDLNLDTGGGDDNVQLTNVTAIDNFFANLGDGNDVLTINDQPFVASTTALFSEGLLGAGWCVTCHCT